MPSARSVPSSRVRSKVESTSVLTMPNSDTITASASSTHRIARICADPRGLAVDEVGLGLDLGVREARRARGAPRPRAVDEREPVAALLERRVERGVRDRDRPEAEHVERGGLLDAAHGQLQLLAAASR